MKTFLVLLVLSFALIGCKKEGQRLGNFKTWCTEQGGSYVKSDRDPTDYMCTLTDGTQRYSN